MSLSAPPLSSLLLLLTVLLHAQLTSAQSPPITFLDVSATSGLPPERSRKFGGAVFCDLDGDGRLDLLMSRHTTYKAVLLFNTGARSGSGSVVFQAARNFDVAGDIHGIIPFRFSPRRKQLHFLVSRGGANGNRLTTPLFFRVEARRLIRQLPPLPSITAGRGRSAVFMNLRLPGKVPRRSDVVITSVFHSFDLYHHRAFRLSLDRSGLEKFTFRNTTPNFASDRNVGGVPVDVDNDGVLEYVSFHWLRVYKVLDEDFKLTDITGTVLPDAGPKWKGTTGVAAFDYNNDGYWDIVTSRSKGQNLHWLANAAIDISDLVLTGNQSGRFKVSKLDPSVPYLDYSRGCTTGDFNNDGYEDILVSKYESPDMLYINRGGTGVFDAYDAGFGNSTGDDVSAVDIDNDGRLEVVVSEGGWGAKEPTGLTRLFRIDPSITIGNYLLVRIGSSPNYRVSSLHAVVFVQCGNLNMRRRVGGAQVGAAVSVSYIETVHFGLANCARGTVRVQWLNGQTVTRRGVSANKVIRLGRFPRR